MEKIIKVNKSPTLNSYVPGIKITGKILEQFNFFLDDFVIVKFSKNEISMKKATKKDLLKKMTEDNQNVKDLVNTLILI